MRYTSIIFTLFLFLAACDCSDEPVPELTNDYLPLSIGNYWNFKAVGGSGDDLTEHREVVDYVTYKSTNYYLLVSTHLSPVWSGNIRDSAYYRVDQDGFVFVYKKSTGIEENRYRLNGEDGDTWSYPFVDDSIANMRLIEGSKNINNQEITNCKDYSFDVAQWADEEYTYTLAPGVGFLKEYSNAWGGGQELKSARIGGKVIEF